MKWVFNILSILIFTISALHAQQQEIQKCDETILLRTSRQMGELKAYEIREFLKTFGRECRINVEYSEWSNELLLLLLDHQTALALTVLDKEEKRIEIDEILYNLSSPVNDLINVSEVISKVEQVTIDPRLKKEILDKLKVAESKLN
jgi:hypothetical protein